GYGCQRMRLVRGSTPGFTAECATCPAEPLRFRGRDGSEFPGPCARAPARCGSSRSRVHLEEGASFAAALFRLGGNLDDLRADRIERLPLDRVRAVGEVVGVVPGAGFWTTPLNVLTM